MRYSPGSVDQLNREDTMLIDDCKVKTISIDKAGLKAAGIDEESLKAGATIRAPHRRKGGGNGE